MLRTVAVRLRMLLPLLLCASLCRGQELTGRQIAHLKSALSKDHREALIGHFDAWGAPALAWIRKLHPGIATWLEDHALCRKLAARMDRLGLPAWRGRKFVRLAWPRLAQVAKPAAAVHRFHHGWLLAEGARSVTLLGRGLTRNRHRLVRDPPTVPVDFEQFCLDYLAHPPGDLGKDVEHLRLGGMDNDGDACALAFFALRLGHRDLAVRLVAHARELSGANLERSIDNEILRTLAWQVARAAYGGSPRAELRRMVERVRVVRPKGAYARTALAHYDRLIGEDKRWIAPTPPDLASMTQEQQVKVWLHRLRDHRAWVSERDRDYASLFAHQLHGNAMRELLNLGWTAFPALIERLDDKRPTRSVLEYTEQPFKGRLVTHGECCGAVLKLLSGRRFKKAAEALEWWVTAQAEGAEASYRKLLEDRKTRAIGVRGLARLDFAKHRQELTRLCERDTDLIEALGREVDDEDLFVGWLNDLETRGIAAIVLWRQFGSDRGAKEMIRAMREWDGRGVPPKELLLGLGRIHTDEVARALVEFLHHKHQIVGAITAVTAADYPHPLVARALRERMKADDQLLRNNAALALALMVRLERDVPLPLHVSEEFVRKLGQWFDDRSDIFDWEELRYHAAR